MNRRRRTEKARNRRRGTAAQRWAGEAPLRVLVGPYVHGEHCAYMEGAFDDFDTLTFGSWEGADVRIEGLYSLDALTARLPGGWQPDLMLLWRPEYTTLPSGLETAPFPVAMLISDWYLAFTDCLEAARFVDRVVTGTRGERVYRTAGFDHVLAMPMLGYQRGFDGAFASPTRDIDVFCAGNPNWTVHRERERVIAEMMKLPAHVNFQHAPMISREEYNRRLGRARIFVNQTVIGEVNMKVYEVTAAETCLFLEEDNLDVAEHLVPGESVVTFRRRDLNRKILHYLEHEEERAAIARRGREVMQARSYRANMFDIVETLRKEGREALLRGGREILRAPEEARRVHHSVFSLRHSDQDLPVLFARVAALPDDPRWRRDALESVLHITAATAPMDRRRGGWWKGMREPEHAVHQLRTWWREHPEDLCGNLAWAQVADAYGAPGEAAQATRRLIEQLEGDCPIPLEAPHLYTLVQKRRFVFERLAWEDVERGVRPDATLRAFLLDMAWDIEAARLRGAGDGRGAIEALRRAVAAFPSGDFTRPRLLQALVDENLDDEAIEVAQAHLEQRPLDNRVRIALFQLLLRGQRIREAADVLAEAERQARVFQDAETVEKLHLLAGHAAEHLRVRMAHTVGAST